MKKATVVMSLAASLLLLGMVADYSRADVPEIPGKIVYIRDGNIWVAKANGDDPQRLTAAGYCSSPGWSPDGTKIAYLRDGNIWIVKTDGSNPQQLTTTEDCSNFSWSPDGTKIAYARGDGDSAYLWCYDLTVRRATRIVPNLILDKAPQWSPDGRRIAFVGRLLKPRQDDDTEGDEGHISSAYEDRLEICSPSGQNRKTLITENSGFCPVFTWSPDAERIYFTAWFGGSDPPTIAFVELSNPGRPHTIYSNMDTFWYPFRFLNEKELVSEGAGLHNSRADDTHQILIANVDTREFRTEVLEPVISNYTACAVSFLGDAGRFWLEGYELGPPDSMGRRFTTEPPLLALVVNGEILKTIEGEEVSWSPKAPLF